MAGGQGEGHALEVDREIKAEHLAEHIRCEVKIGVAHNELPCGELEFVVPQGDDPRGGIERVVHVRIDEKAVYLPADGIPLVVDLQGTEQAGKRKVERVVFVPSRNEGVNDRTEPEFQEGLIVIIN